MKKSVTAFALAFLLAFGGLFVTTAPASAANCSLNGVLCGKVKLTSNSDRYLIITNNAPEPGKLAILHPGEKSTKFFNDTDMIKAPVGCTIRTTYSGYTQVLGGGKWHKITDTLLHRLTSVSC